jgi:hypothetical protein
MEESSPIIKYGPGLKAKILGFLIPVIVLVGIAMVLCDHFNVANAQDQNAAKTGALLLVYSLFMFRGLNRYRIFLEIHPDRINWTQGIQVFKKNYTIPYSQIDSLSVTVLTTSLIFNLKPENGLPKLLRFPPSLQRVEGTLVKPEAADLEKEIGTQNPKVREVYYLKYEIEKRMATTSTG